MGCVSGRSLTYIASGAPWKTGQLAPSKALCTCHLAQSARSLRTFSCSAGGDIAAAAPSPSTQPPPLRMPLYLWLQRPTAPQADAAHCARLLALPAKPRHFLTTSRPLLHHFAECVAAPSDFPKPRATLCFAELESGATLEEVSQFVVERVSPDRPPSPPTSPSTVVGTLKAAASGGTQIYILLDCCKVRQVDASSLLRVLLDFDSVSRLSTVTLGVAASEELLQSLGTALVHEHCSRLRTGADIQENETLEVEHPSLGRRGGFLVKRGGLLYGYRNWCPHIGMPLNMFPNRFWNFNQQFLSCTTHGALFLPEDGLCVAGPCAGKSLRPMPLLLSATGDVLLPSPPMRSLLTAVDAV
eukprot:GGOE01005650.1.p1 GENE.GGOE01005650.1~~GGOE01005650.1.p1  ORF type:complete len:364 (-),score=51.92 GGOE01005650.1:597-1667(-)